MDQHKKSVSVIIPNYNGRHLLEAYLPFTYTSIRNAGVAFEIIVVDDCSKDDSVTFIRSAYPEIKLTVSPQNGGFSKACNIGVYAAQYELLLILNSDVKLTPDYFDGQWEYFLKPDTFGVMGRIIDMEGDGIQDAARMPKFNGFKLKTAYFYYRTENDAPSYTLYLSGANALVDAAKMKAIGGFDEIFSPFYGEDLELSLRAWRQNWLCYYEHQAICRHMGQGSTKNYKTAKWVKSIYYRNRFFVHAIHLNGLPLLLWFLQITVVDLLPKLIAGQLWMWSSYVALLKNWGAVKQSKAKVKMLMDNNNSHTSVFAVVDTIKALAQSNNIVRLKA